MRAKLQVLQDVGLGYLHLGQSSNTLSGGEAQRVKLAYFLCRGGADEKGHVFFIFDEPTTGLHFHDIAKLKASFDALIARGHTVLVIEHHLDVIKSADWIIEMGPEGGDAGGKLLYAGTPEGLLKVKDSYTAKYLRPKLEGEPALAVAGKAKVAERKPKASTSGKPKAVKKSTSKK